MRTWGYQIILLAALLLWIPFGSAQAFKQRIVDITRPSGNIILLKKDASNRLLIGSDRELMAYDGRISNRLWTAGSNERITAVHPAVSENIIVIITDKRIVRIPSIYTTVDSITTITELAAIGSSHLFDDELIYQDDGVICLFNTSSSKKVTLPSIPSRIKAFYRESNSYYLFGDQLYQWTKGDSAYTTLSVEFPPGNNRIYNNNSGVFIISETGQLWMWNAAEKKTKYLQKLRNNTGFSKGQVFHEMLYLISSSGIDLYSGGRDDGELVSRDQLCFTDVKTMYMEDVRHVWISDGRELCLLIDDYPVLVNASSGLSDERIQAAMAWKDEIWLGNRSGLYRYQNGLLKTERSDFETDFVSALHTSSTDEAWAGMTNQGLVFIEAQGQLNFIDSSDFPPRQIASINSNRDSTILIGTVDAGLWQGRIDTSGSWRFERRFSNSLDAILDVVALDNGDLVLAEANTLYYFDSGRGQLQELYRTQAHTLNDIDLWNGWVYAAAGSNLIRVPLQPLGEVAEVFDADEFMLSSVTAVHASSNQLFIAGGAKTTAVPVAYFNRSSSIDSFVYYDFAISKNCLLSVDGNNIAGTNKGLVSLEINNAAQLHGQLVFENVWVNDASIDWMIDSLFSHDHQRWRFDLRSVHPEYTGQIIYKWTLKSASIISSDETDQRTVYFSALTPGNYVFSVQGFGDGLVTNRLDYTFTINPSVWSANWFSWMSLLIGLVLGSLLIYVISKSNRKRNKKRRAVLAWENERLELQQKALQLQMNPHFIFNALNSIQGFIGKDEAQARRYTAKLGKLMRQTLLHARATWINLDDEIEYLKHYLDLERLNYNFEFDVDKRAIADDVYIPSMIIQPIVENAVRHGMANRNDKNGKIKVTFKYQGRKIKCSIQDNGPGVEASTNKEKHIGLSTKIINERMEIFRSEGLNVDPVQLVESSPEGDFTTCVLVGLPYKEDDNDE